MKVQGRNHYYTKWLVKRGRLVMKIDNLSIDQDRVLEAVASDEYLGFCIACGSEQENVEPDARRYKCDSCDKRAVYGAQELLFQFFESMFRKPLVPIAQE